MEELDPIRLLVVRHGQATYQSDGPALTELGRRQSAALAAALAQEPIDMAFASPLPRAIETASFLQLDIPVIQEDRLREFDFGIEGFQIGDDRADLELWKPDHRPPGGETLRSFHGRVTSFLEELVTSSVTGSTVVLVTHAGVIDVTGRWVFGASGEAPWLQEIEAPNASIMEIVCWPDGRHPRGSPRYYAVRRMADATHLTPEQVSLH